MEKTKLLNRIIPHKDVDGLHAEILALPTKNCDIAPLRQYGHWRNCTAHHLDFTGLNVTIVGASILTGQPIAQYFLQHGATPTLCHIDTRNLASHIQRADVIVSSIGQTSVIQTEWMQPGVMIFDVGTNHLANGRTTGDIDFVAAQKLPARSPPIWWYRPNYRSLFAQ